MSVPSTSARRWTVRFTAAAAVTAAVAGTAILQAGDATAGTSTLFSITAISPGHVADATKNQVITVTGTGFDESLINGVSISGCTTDPNYIVQSATTLLVKTAAKDCSASADLTAASSAKITITDSNGDTYKSDPTKGAKLQFFFVDPPSIATASATVRPMMTDYTNSLAYASQVNSASTSGGTVVRVVAGTVKFTNASAYPLSAAFDGVAMTNLKMHTGGDYFTATLGAHAADLTPVLKITNNGVTKSFPYDNNGATAADQTQDFTLAGNTITVSPAFGGIAGGNTLTVSGSGFTSATTVTVDGNNCTGFKLVSATKVTCTVPAGSAAGPVLVATSTSGLDSVVSAGSSYTYLDQ